MQLGRARSEGPRLTRAVHMVRWRLFYRLFSQKVVMVIRARRVRVSEATVQFLYNNARFALIFEKCSRRTTRSILRFVHRFGVLALEDESFGGMVVTCTLYCFKLVELPYLAHLPPALQRAPQFHLPRLSEFAVRQNSNI